MHLSRFQHIPFVQHPAQMSSRPDCTRCIVTTLVCLCLTLTLAMQPFGLAWATPTTPASSGETNTSAVSASHFHLTIDALGRDGTQTAYLDKNLTVDAKVWKAVDLLSEASVREGFRITYLKNKVESLSHDSFIYTNYTGEEEIGSWQLYINNRPVDDDALVLAEGDRIHLQFEVKPVAQPEPETTATIITPPEPTSTSTTNTATDAYWPDFGPDKPYNSNTALPTSQKDTACAWKHTVQTEVAPGENESLIKIASDALEVNQKLYAAYTVSTFDNATYASTPREMSLQMSDISTGKILKEVTLPNGINSTARLVYHDGLIIVPLLQAQIAAFDADTLKMVWVTPKRSTNGQDEQILSSLKVSNNVLIVGTTSGWGDGPGALLGIDPHTGKTLWSHTAETGYYWNGSASVGSAAVISGNNGKLQTFNPQTGAVLSTVDLSTKARTQIMLIPNSTDCLVNLYNGTLQRYHIASDGSLTLVASTSYGTYSTSTPRVVGNKVVLLGSEGTKKESKGYLYIFNLNDLGLATKVITAYETTDNEGKPITVTPTSQSTPLVVSYKDQTYLYFVCNAMPGSLLSYHMGDKAISTVYQPEKDEQNYSMSSPMLLSNGYVVYTNDSGTRFALRAKPQNPTPVDPSNPDPIKPPKPPVDPPKPPEPAVPLKPTDPSVAPVLPTKPTEESSYTPTDELTPAVSAQTEVSDQSHATSVESSESTEVASAPVVISEQPTEVTQSDDASLMIQPDQAPVQTKSLLGSYILWGSLIVAGLSLLGLFFVLSVSRASR